MLCKNIKLDLNKSILKAMAIVFFSGIFIHLFGLVNVLHNYDDIANLPSGFGTGIQSGRWFLTILARLTRKTWGIYNLQLFNGVILILLLSLSLGFIMDFLKIKSCKIGVLIGLILVSFPTTTSTLFFTHTATFYGVAIFLAVLAAWLVEKGRFGFVFSMVCIALSLGIYQAYLPITISLLVLHLLKKSFESSASFVDIFKEGLYFCACLLGGLILYYCCLKISLKIFNASLLDYQGISSMGKIGISDIPNLVMNAILIVLILPFKDYCQIAPTFILKLGYLIVYVISMVLVISIIYKKKKSISNIIMILLLLFGFLLAINFIYVMCPNSSIYTLMVFSFSILLIFIVVIYCVSTNLNVGNLYIRKGLLVVVTIMILNYIYLDNYNYTAMYYTTRQTENYLNSLITQVRMTEGFSVDKKWAFIGENINDPLMHNAFDGEIELYGGNGYEYYNAYSRMNWVKFYFGYTIPMAEEKDVDNLLKNNEVKNMPCWPNDGSIKVIDDNVVIKLEDISE